MHATKKKAKWKKERKKVKKEEWKKEKKRARKKERKKKKEERRKKEEIRNAFGSRVFRARRGNQQRFGYSESIEIIGPRFLSKIWVPMKWLFSFIHFSFSLYLPFQSLTDVFQIIMPKTLRKQIIPRSVNWQGPPISIIIKTPLKTYIARTSSRLQWKKNSCERFAFRSSKKIHSW